MIRPRKLPSLMSWVRGVVPQAVAEAGASVVPYLWTPLRVRQAADAATVASLTIVKSLDRDVSVTDVVNSVAETDVYSFSVPGGTLSTNRMLRLTLFFDYLNNTGGAVSNPRIRVVFGATTIIDFATGVSNFAASATRYPIIATTELSALNATGAQVARGRIDYTTGSTNGVSGGDITTGFPRHALHNGIAEDSTAAKTLAVKVTNSTASANHSTRLLVAQLELI